ncbi:MAG: penicillin-binding transpeptidase domain-containing protein [Bacteroidota bacterium]
MLKLYLNTVSFSENVFGIKIAAQRFFNTSANKLKAEQAAVLIGMLKATSRYNPVRHPERALVRRNVVLHQMQKYEYLTPAVQDSLSNLPLKLDYYKGTNSNKTAAYFKEQIRLELSQILPPKDSTEQTYNVYTDGLKIYTTLDMRLQGYAEKAVETHIHQLQKLFDKHWKGRKPWANNQVLQQAVARSTRYQKLKGAGWENAAIQANFQEAVPMQLYDKKGGEISKVCSPLDSVKHYLSLLHAGFLAADPRDGTIKAWVGGIDYQHFQYDHIRSKRQVGSTFKPVVYAAALKEGLEPCHYFQNELISYPKWENWQPRNANGQYGGFYSMAGGLSQSINTVTVEILFHTGIQKVRQLAKRLGITSEIPEGPAIALGTVESSLYDMVQVYSTFANNGKRVDLHFIERVEDSAGKVLYAAPKAKTDQILSQNQNDIMTKLMESVVQNGTGRPLHRDYGVSGEIAGKTGTTQNQSDGWFIAYGPKLVAGAWVGAESPHVHFRTLKLGQGAKTALPIYGDFMRRLYRDKAYKSIRFARFRKVTDETLARLECDAFLSDDLLDSVFEPEDERNFIDRFLDRPQAAQLEDGQIDPVELEQLEREVQRLERKSERKAKRKAFWNDLLFGKKKKN